MNKAIPVVLVNPPAETPREHHDTPDYPAIGIGYLANYLLKKGIEARIIDAKLSRKTVQQTVSEIVSLHPKILGLSSFTHMIMTTSRIASAVKRTLPDTKIVVGGFHVTFLPEKSLKEFPEFDFLVIGEGELAFHALVQALLNKSEYKDIHGIAFRENGLYKVNGRGEIPDHLDKLGMPAWELFPREDIKKYVKRFPLMTQRGCPFHCNFCSRPYGNKVRTRSIESVLVEIERNLDDYDCKEMMFYDETFTVDKKYVSVLCDMIVERGLNHRFHWSATVHANTIDLELLRKMKKAGCTYLGFGVESGDEDIIASMGKGITRERALRAAKMIKDAQISIGAYFIFGHPNETFKQCKETIQLAIKMNPDIPVFGIMVPYPGSKVWELAILGEGGYKSISQNWDDYNKQIGNAVELKSLSISKMVRLQLEGYAKVYLYNFRWIKLGKMLYLHRKRFHYIIWQLVKRFVRGCFTHFTGFLKRLALRWNG